MIVTWINGFESVKWDAETGEPVETDERDSALAELAAVIEHLDAPPAARSRSSSI